MAQPLAPISRAWSTHLLDPHVGAIVRLEAADEEPAVVDAGQHADAVAAPDLVVVEVVDGALGVLQALVHDEGIAAVGAGEHHHEAQLVDVAHALEDGEQLVLVAVAGDLAHEHLAVPETADALVKPGAGVRKS